MKTLLTFIILASLFSCNDTETARKIYPDFVVAIGTDTLSFTDGSVDLSKNHRHTKGQVDSLTGTLIITIVDTRDINVGNVNGDFVTGAKTVNK